MNRLRVGADGDVFRDDAEVRAGFGKAAFEIGFIGKLVLKHIQIGHAQSVESRGFEQRVVPLKRGKTLRGAFAIEGFEKLALGIVTRDLRVRMRGAEKS